MKTATIPVFFLATFAAALPEAYVGKAQGCKESWGPIPYTSIYRIVATPEQVVNGTNFTGGQPGAVGYYDFGINSHYNLICYRIRLCGFGDATYQSPADTATHIHQAIRGASGPPRIAFPNPQPAGDTRLSVGCLQGPFETGVQMNGTDTGAGFHVSQIEVDPAAFFADVHTNVAVPGAVRGQL